MSAISRRSCLTVWSDAIFSGWENYVKAPSGPVSPTLRFKHHFIDNTLGQAPGQMADVGRLGLADLDSDGDNDTVDVYQWLENDGSGTSWQAHPIPFGKNGHNEKTPRGTAYGYGWSARSVVIDVDSDGDNDIVAVDCDQVDATAAVLFNDGHANFTKTLLPQNKPRYGSFHSLQVADFNQDGRLDVATVEQQDITWQISVFPRWIIWTQLDDNQWQEDIVLDNGIAGHDMVSGDVDGDGDIDLVAKVWNAYAQGSGTWGTHELEYVSFVENLGAASKD